MVGNVQLQRQHLTLSHGDLVSKAPSAVEATCNEIRHLLKRRLSECQAVLEKLTLYGAETAEEKADRERTLYEFWALAVASLRTNQ